MSTQTHVYRSQSHSALNSYFGRKNKAEEALVVAVMMAIFLDLDH